MKSPGLRLLLVRHGEDWGSVEDEITGAGRCKGLTQRGHRQAEALAHHLSTTEPPLDIIAVYSTTVPRAVQTAQPIAHALEVPLRQEFPYTVLGDAEGRSRSYLHARNVECRRDSPDQPLAPGADTWATAARRVGLSLDRLLTSHPGQTIVIVGHRETIIAAGQHFQRIPHTLVHSTADTDHTAVTEWQYRASDRRPDQQRWVLVRHNDTRHLTPVLPKPASGCS